MMAAKKALSMTLRMARGTATAMGLAVMLAVVFGVGTAALAAVPGDPFELGRINTIGKITGLAGTTDNALLRLDNDSKGANATALDLRVNPAKPPMRVDSFAKVEKLNADLLDGQSADQFVSLGGKAFDSGNLDGKDSTAYFSGKNYGVFQVAGGGGGGSSKTLEVNCDPGDTVLSGGGGSLDSEDHLSKSIPITQATGWQAMIRDNNISNSVFVSAVCADFPPLRP